MTADPVQSVPGAGLQRLLEIRALGKAFQTDGRSRSFVLQGIDFDIAAGEFVLVVGANGSGKTTLLNLITGALVPTTGSIHLRRDGAVVDWNRLSRRDRSRHLARVYQDPQQGTVTDMTLEDNLRLVTMTDRFPSPFRLKPSNHDGGAYEATLDRSGVPGRRRSHMSELSQGQRQILALEMALLRHPSLLVLDEPTASLDRPNATRCMETIGRIAREEKVAALVVTHNLGDALRYGDRLVVLREGRLVANLAGEQKRTLDAVGILGLCGFVEMSDSRS
jgi:putative tryptophan/tyrosine transport system ATP-binding protein